jgi:hypothetical protein
MTKKTVDPSKARIHRFLTDNPAMLDDLKTNALQPTPAPKDETARLWYEAGRRARDIELLSIYQEVEEASR